LGRGGPPRSWGAAGDTPRGRLRFSVTLACVASQ
jgi:hypothetical protein